MTPNTGPDGVHIANLANDLPQEWIRTIPGVRPTYPAGLNAIGAGLLRSSSDGFDLTWRAPGSSADGPAVTVSASASETVLLLDGDDSDRFVEVVTTPGRMAAGPVSAPVELRHGSGSFLSVVTAAQASAGLTTDQALQIVNDSPNAVEDVRLWLDSAASGFGFLSIAKDPGGPFVSPDSESHGDTLIWATIPVGGSENFTLRRTIPAAQTSLIDVLGSLRAAWTGY